MKIYNGETETNSFSDMLFVKRKGIQVQKVIVL